MRQKRRTALLMSLFLSLSVGFPDCGQKGEAAAETAGRSQPHHEATAPLDQGGKMIALTFDDGPHGSRTALILDELKRRGAKATFFVVGSLATRYPDLIRRMATEGHEIGNHTWNHPFLTRTSDTAIQLQMSRTQEAVRQAVGFAPKVMRPPFGAISRRVQRQLGLPAIFWSVDTRDYVVRRPENIFRSAVANTRPGDIILCHDYWSAPAVGRIVDYLTSQGYRLVTVSQLLGFADGSRQPVPGRIYWGQRQAQ